MSPSLWAKFPFLPFPRRHPATCLHRVFPERSQILGEILHYTALKLRGCQEEAINAEAEREREREEGEKERRERGESDRD